MSQSGLSPRVRGNPGQFIQQWYVDGSIPACAGEPTPWGVVIRPDEVYPRVCGGTLYNPPGEEPGGGLSPRVRGNLHVLSQPELRQRSIPACAGEPEVRAVVQLFHEVYPRVCGGTRPCGRLLCPKRGLSPRVRGNLKIGTQLGKSERSIPACAGEPRLWLGWMEEQAVYPRVCGGTRNRGRRAGRNRGLSPRVRGNLREETDPKVWKGSIPACAGEPKAKNAKAIAARVYPRVCGGT